MITPSHVIYSWAFAKKTQQNQENTLRTKAYILGALFPDIPTYLFFIICGVLLGYSGDQLWGDMYFNSSWSIPITLTHSFIIWPIFIAFSSFFGYRLLRWFSISALFHTVVDFCVHTDDAYRHFYPFSNWKFHSPISYYNPLEYGQYVNFFDSLLVLGLLYFLYTRYQKDRYIRFVVIGLALLYIVKLGSSLFVHHM